jgi:hypothetical protein
MPDLWLDVDTALTEVPVNILPIVGTDGITIDTGVVYNEAGLTLVWNFTNSAGVTTQTAVTPTNTGGDYDWVNQGNGMYTIEIPASAGASINNNAEGYGWFTGKATATLAWRSPVIGFRAAAINDALVDGGDNLVTISTGPQVLQSTTIATLASQTSFTLTAGSSDDNAYINQMAIITDFTTGTQKAVGLISGYTGATKTVTLEVDPGIFTMAQNDLIDIVAITGNQVGLYVDANGYVQIEGTKNQLDDLQDVSLASIRDILLPEANVAFNNIPFVFKDTAGNYVIGATGITITRSIDGAAFAAADAGTNVNEVGNGLYEIDAAAADMNGGKITFRVAATGGTPGAPQDKFVSIITTTGT